MRLQPRRKGKVFPDNSDTISRRFTDACKFLEIDDLRFQTYVTKPFLVFSKWGSRCLRLLRYQGTKAGNPCNAIPI